LAEFWKKNIYIFFRCPQIPPIDEPPPLLKSSSAGLIKCPTTPITKPKTPPPPPPRRLELKKMVFTYAENKESKEVKEPPPSPLDESIDITLQTYKKKPASPSQVS